MHSDLFIYTGCEPNHTLVQLPYPVCCLAAAALSGASIIAVQPPSWAALSPHQPLLRHTANNVTLLASSAFNVRIDVQSDDIVAATSAVSLTGGGGISCMPVDPACATLPGQMVVSCVWGCWVADVGQYVVVVSSGDGAGRATMVSLHVNALVRARHACATKLE